MAGNPNVRLRGVLTGRGPGWLMWTSVAGAKQQLLRPIPAGQSGTSSSSHGRGHLARPRSPVNSFPSPYLTHKSLVWLEQNFRADVLNRLFEFCEHNTKVRSIGGLLLMYNRVRTHEVMILLTSKKWRLQREGRQSRRQGVEMKSDWLFDKPRSNHWLRVAASNLASQSPCLAGVTQSHCNPQ